MNTQKQVKLTTATRGRRVLSMTIAAFCAAAAVPSMAADCYWAGGTSSDWGTVANWTTGNKVPDNDGAYFRSDKFNNNFKSGNRAYLVTFDAAHTNNWRTYFNNCGTASAPIILRGSNASCGLTSGDSTSNKDTALEGIYIGTNQTGGNSGTTDSKASTGDAYLRFETGTFSTGPTGKYSYFFLGNNTYAGHMTVAGATINALNDFKIYSGDLTIESGTVYVTYWMRFENTSKAKAINLNGGTLHTYRAQELPTQEDVNTALEDAWQAWSFGPVLLNSDGSAIPDFSGRIIEYL